MKKYILLFIAVLTILVLNGCGSTKPNNILEVKETESESHEVTSKTEEKTDNYKLLNCERPINVVPDPEEYFDKSDITLMQNEETGLYYLVHNVTDETSYNYIDACTSGLFDDVVYKTDTDDFIVVNAYDAEKQYYLEITMSKADSRLDIICNVSKEKVEE